MADHGQFGFGRPKIKAMLASGLAVNKRCGLAGRPGLPEHGVNQLTHEGAAPSPRLRKRVNLCELGCLDLEAQRLFHVRSEGRRVGKECVSTCKSRWVPD